MNQHLVNAAYPEIESLKGKARRKSYSMFKLSTSYFQNEQDALIFLSEIGFGSF